MLRNPMTGGSAWYHGSPADFDAFRGARPAHEYDPNKPWNTMLGDHFTAHHETAHEFGMGLHSSIPRPGWGGTPKEGYVYHAHLDVKKPLYFDDEGDFEHHIGHVLREHVSSGGSRNEGSQSVYLNWLHRNGHDAVVYGNEHEGPHRHPSIIVPHGSAISIASKHSAYDDSDSDEHAPKGPRWGKFATAQKQQWLAHIDHLHHYDVPEGDPDPNGEWAGDPGGDDGWSVADLKRDISANGIHAPLEVARSRYQMQQGDHGIYVFNGNHRLRAARLLGMTHVPVTYPGEGAEDAEPLEDHEYEALHQPPRKQAVVEQSGVPGTVYLLHFSEPFGHAMHYMGWASDLDGRLWHHQNGTGANLLKHVKNAGISWQVARTWDGDRNLERRLKNQGGHSRKCPMCKEQGINPPDSATVDEQDLPPTEASLDDDDIFAEEWEPEEEREPEKTCSLCGNHMRLDGTHPYNGVGPHDRCPNGSEPIEEREDRIFHSLDPLNYCHEGCRESHAADIARGIGVHHTFAPGEAEHDDDRNLPSMVAPHSQSPHEAPGYRSSGEYEYRDPSKELRCHYCRNRLVDPTLGTTAAQAKLYLRIGDWHPSETSRNYVTGEPERGVSVYDLDEHGEPVVPPEGEWSEADMHTRLSSDEPKHLVTGDEVGVGQTEEEPLLKHIRRVGEWPQDHPAKKHTATSDHETLYHITDRHHFTLDPEHAPEDNAFAIQDRSHYRGLYVTDDPDKWRANGYHRPYVAEIHIPHGVAQQERWHGEKFIPAEHFDKIKVHRVMPFDQHQRERWGDTGTIEDTQGPASTPPDKDVRDFTPQEHTEHLKRLRDHLHDVEGYGWNEFNDAHEHVGSDETDDGGMPVRRDRAGDVMTRGRYAALTNNVFHVAPGESEQLHKNLPDKRLFAPTKTELDPALFDGDHLKPAVRQGIIDLYANFWDSRHPTWRRWAKLFFTGSQASYWWGNHDFDTLVGVKYDVARRLDPKLMGLSDSEIDDTLNAEFRHGFNNEDWIAPWSTSKTDFWHLTGYVNTASWDIARIRPYSAYDVIPDKWVVHPDQVAPDWSVKSFGEAFIQRAERVIKEIARIERQPNQHLRAMEGQALWDYIHGDRSRAFSEHGTGWKDWANGLEKYLDQRGWLPRLIDLAHQGTHEFGQLHLLDRKDSYDVAPGNALGTTAMGQRGDLPEGLDYRHYDNGDWRAIDVHHGEDQVGTIMWNTADDMFGKGRGEIENVEVHPDYQRRGLATEMLRRAREVDPSVHHSTTLTSDGMEWRRKTAIDEDFEPVYPLTNSSGSSNGRAEAGKNRKRVPPQGGGRGGAPNQDAQAPVEEDNAGSDASGRWSPANPAPLEKHPKVTKDLGNVHPNIAKKFEQVVAKLQVGERHPQTHPLFGKLKGWEWSPLGYHHRVVHRYTPEGLEIGWVGTHENSDAANTRLGVTAEVRHLTEAIGTDDEPPTGIMVHLVPPMKHIEPLLPPDGEHPDVVHMTLAYLGSMDDHSEEQLRNLPEVIASWAEGQQPIDGHIQGVGTFVNTDNPNENERHVLWAAADIPGLPHAHVSLLDHLKDNGYKPYDNHGFTPHITLGYSKHHWRFLPKLEEKKPWPVREVWLALGPQWQSFPLGT